MTPEQAVQGEFLNAISNQVVRSAGLAAEVAALQQRVQSLLEQNENQAKELEELKKVKPEAEEKK